MVELNLLSENLLKKIVARRYQDQRGFFTETYSRTSFLSLEIDVEFVQDNHSFSRSENTVRGLHFQAPPRAQAKLVRCVRGAVLDVAVDIRRGSPTYGKWEGHKLTAENGHQLYIPVGFAHGFATLEPDSEIIYKCSDYYAPETEGSILWNDPDIGIDWCTFGEPAMSDKDLNASTFEDLESPFIYGDNS